MKRIISVVLSVMMLCSVFAQFNLSITTAAEIEEKATVGTSGQIYFDASKWGRANQIYCHIYIIGGGQFFNVGSSQEKCTNISGALWMYDLANLDSSSYISGGLKTDVVYGLCFLDDMGRQGADLTFGLECVGDRAYLTGNVINNLVNPEKEKYEMFWTKNSSKYGPSKGELYYKDLEITPVSGTTAMITGCRKANKNMVIPETIRGYKIVGIESQAFERCANLISVTIPDSVTSIGESSFYDCTSLEKVIMGNSVKTVGANAFSGCLNLESVILPVSCQSVGEKAFWGCINLKNIVFKNPDCIIYEDMYTISSLATIYGYGHSTADMYATEYNRKFAHLEDINEHLWDDGEVVKEATYFKAGKKAQSCIVCGEIETITILKLKLVKPTVKVTGDKKKITVKYTKVTGATGFEVKYKIGKKSVTKTFKAKKNVTKTIQKLAKGTYRVQIRAFVKQNGKTAYSKWTKATKVKVK